MKSLNVFMADDHPFIIEAYNSTLEEYKSQYNISITKANDCKKAYEIVNDKEAIPFDVAFLDVSMPPYEEKNILSGEDIAKILLNKMPGCKIIMLTMHSDALRVVNIVKEINPNGLIIKNDLTIDELRLAFERVLNGNNYYSQTVVKYISGSLSINRSNIDELDRQIIYHISRGVKTKNIPQYTSMSLSTIEKRKQNLKESFNIKNGSDEDLIRIAREKGFI